MQKFTVPCSETPQIVLEQIGGDLNLKGADLTEIIIKTDRDAPPQIETTGNRIQITCADDSTIYVPHNASIHILEVSGDASIKSLGGDLRIETIGRELALRDIGKIRATQIGTDLSARRVRGDLIATAVGRAVMASDIDGSVQLQSVGAHLHLRDISGGVDAQVGGNADVVLSPVPWQTYTIGAGGNILCRLLDDDINLQLTANSGGQRIHIALPEFADTILQSQYQITLGEGGAPLTLNAGGNIQISARRSDWETSPPPQPSLKNLGIDIEAEINTQLQSFSGNLDAYLKNLDTLLQNNLLTPEKAERARQRVEQARQRATERSQNAAQRIQERLARKLENVRRREPPPPVPPIPPIPPVPGVPPVGARKFVWPAPAAKPQPVTEDERMLILKMLESGTISLEEAEKLLAALEG